jgi:hypothetical protein
MKSLLLLFLLPYITLGINDKDVREHNIPEINARMGHCPLDIDINWV